VFGLSPQILGAILLAVGLFTSGWTVEHWRMRGKVADLKREYAEQAVKAEAEAAKRLKDAQILGDALVERVAREENKRIEVEDQNHALLSRLTTGRRCLDAAAVRVLNNRNGAAPGGVPETPGQPAGADAQFATDTDVGKWAATAIRYYDDCRSRIDALREFHHGQ